MQASHDFASACALQLQFRSQEGGWAMRMNRTKAKKKSKIPRMNHSQLQSEYGNQNCLNNCFRIWLGTCRCLAQHTWSLFCAFWRQNSHWLVSYQQVQEWQKSPNVFSLCFSAWLQPIFILKQKEMQPASLSHFQAPFSRGQQPLHSRSSPAQESPALGSQSRFWSCICYQCMLKE